MSTHAPPYPPPSRMVFQKEDRVKCLATRFDAEADRNGLVFSQLHLQAGMGAWVHGTIKHVCVRRGRQTQRRKALYDGDSTQSVSRFRWAEVFYKKVPLGRRIVQEGANAGRTTNVQKRCKCYKAEGRTEFNRAGEPTKNHARTSYGCSIHGDIFCCHETKKLTHPERSCWERHLHCID